METRITILEAELEMVNRIVASFRPMGPDSRNIEPARHAVDQIDATSVVGHRVNGAGFPILARNECIEFSNLNNAIFLGGGWWGTEPWGIWGRGKSELRFCTGKDYAGGYLEVRLVVQGIPSTTAQRPSLQILANGFFLGDFEISGMQQPLRLRLPPAAIGDGNILMILDYSDPQIPVPVGGVSDPRTLGIGLISLLLP
ncbi:MAG: hypothetical protein PSY12_10340 [bacterium]|nr:hypothetical protein [bacterium]